MFVTSCLFGLFCCLRAQSVPVWDAADAAWERELELKEEKVEREIRE